MDMVKLVQVPLLVPSNTSTRLTLAPAFSPRVVQSTVSGAALVPQFTSTTALVCPVEPSGRTHTSAQWLE